MTKSQSFARDAVSVVTRETMPVVRSRHSINWVPKGPCRRDEAVWRERVGGAKGGRPAGRDAPVTTRSRWEKDG